jgi:hypothetical protein
MIINIPPELPTMRPYTCPDLETDKPTEIWDFIHKNRDLEQFKTTRPPKISPIAKGQLAFANVQVASSEMCIRQYEMMWQKLPNYIIMGMGRLSIVFLYYIYIAIFESYNPPIPLTLRPVSRSPR